MVKTTHFHNEINTSGKKEKLFIDILKQNPQDGINEMSCLAGCDKTNTYREMRHYQTI